jgi:glucan phosphoethanolaminetransferase (alkaline phosphatase superfamily)
MIRPDRPAWEISMQKIGHTVLAVVFAAPAALIVWKLSIWRVIGPTFGLVFFLVTFVVFALVFYSFLEWLFRKRPDEIAKRVPTPSKELRRRTKQFFDNLPK